MTDDEPNGKKLFQGSELPRLVLLTILMVAGWVFVWNYLKGSDPQPLPDPEIVVDGAPAKVVTDRSPEFETVKDKTALSFRDSAAYAKLLKQAREETADSLASKARQDIFYAQLWGDPEKYRGVPVHILGTTRRVLRYESSLSQTGWLYEAWVFSTDSQSNPIVCVFEDAPKGLPIGSNLSERVVFNGYFLKLMRYEAGDVTRAAPLLVGRIGWTPSANANRQENRPGLWLAGAVGVMFLISLSRWVWQLKRSLVPKRRMSLLRDRPTEFIAPEELNDWLENVGDSGNETPES